MLLFARCIRQIVNVIPMITKGNRTEVNHLLMYIKMDKFYTFNRSIDILIVINNFPTDLSINVLLIDLKFCRIRQSLWQNEENEERRRKVTPSSSK